MLAILSVLCAFPPIVSTLASLRLALLIFLMPLGNELACNELETSIDYLAIYDSVIMGTIDTSNAKLRVCDLAVKH